MNKLQIAGLLYRAMRATETELSIMQLKQLYDLDGQHLVSAIIELKKDKVIAIRPSNHLISFVYEQTHAYYKDAGDSLLISSGPLMGYGQEDRWEDFKTQFVDVWLNPNDRMSWPRLLKTDTIVERLKDFGIVSLKQLETNLGIQ